MAGPYVSQYPTENSALKDIAGVVNDPYGAWATMQRYYNQASDVQTYIDTVTRDIEEAKAQPGYKSSKELQDYVSGLMKTIQKVREGFGSGSVATPGINPNASTSGVMFEGSYADTSNIVKESQEKFEGSPAGKATNAITDWISDNLQNLGFIVLGVVVVGVAISMTAKKQVIEVVKGAATEILTS